MTVTVTETRERERAGPTESQDLTTQAGPEGKTAQEQAVAEVETAAMAGSTMETGRKGRTGQEEVALVMMARAALETEVAEKDSPEMAVQVTEVTALKDLGAAMAMAMAMGETQVPEILEPALTTETVPGMALATTDLDLEGVEATMEIQEVAVAVAVAVAVVMMEARIIKATRTGAMEEVTQAVMEAIAEEAGREAMGVAA